MEPWTDLPLDMPLYQNVDLDAVVGYQTAIENGFRNDFGGHTRLPALKTFAVLEDQGRVSLNDQNGNLIAATTEGGVYSVDQSGNVTNRTAQPVAGGRRVIISKADKELLFAAGSDIVRLRAEKTEILSPDAPKSTHVGYIDGYVLAYDTNSQIWYHSDAGNPDVWNALNAFVADGNPDNINGLLITPFREIMITGPQSIEQFERVQSGDQPFYKRWAIGDGVSAPYCLSFADNALWSVNKEREIVRSSAQVPTAVSVQIGKILESADDWSDAWIGGYPNQPFNFAGQKFILIQLPNATNSYGSKGITFLYDYRRQEWSELYGFDIETGFPSRWPGWSHWRLWDRMFIGGEGVIYEMDPENYAFDNQPQRWLVRTAHVSAGDSMLIKDLRLIMKRGLGTPTTESKIWVRASRDGRPFGRKVERTLGKAGHRNMMVNFGGFGDGQTIQFEIGCTDNVPVELLKAQVKLEALGV